MKRETALSWLAVVPMHLESYLAVHVLTFMMTLDNIFIEFLWVYLRC